MLYFAMGDSNMMGSNTEKSVDHRPIDSNNFFNLVATHFDLVYECFAKNGASNDHIIRITRKWIDSHKDQEKFVFIGWSTWEREEYKIGDMYYDIDAWRINNLSNLVPLLNERADKLKEKIEQNPNYMDWCAQQWSKKISDFAKELESSNVGYFFWNAYMPLKRSAEHKAEFDHRYLRPYEESFNQFWYLKNIRNHAPKPHDPYHFDKQGNQKWADFLIQYIKDWKILPEIKL